MIQIVDASVAIKWFVREAGHDQALRLLAEQADTLQAPDLILAETADVAWRKAFRMEITAEQARRIPAAVREAVAVLHPSADLVDAALDMALQLDQPVQPCLYLACAERAGGVLVTADDRFARALRRTRFEGLARRL